MLKSKIEPPKPTHSECPQITCIAQVFKTFIYVYKELALILYNSYSCKMVALWNEPIYHESK
jgi:hypothetical protein